MARADWRVRGALGTALKVGAPLLAIATLMLGLRVGAGEAVRAAVVFGAPPGRVATGEKTHLAWQMITFLDDRGVRETIPMRGLSVVGRAKGQESRWTGTSNLDGVAEIDLSFEGLSAGDAVDLEVRQEGDAAPLAAGRASWQSTEWGRPRDEHDRDSDLHGGVRPTSRKGSIGLDVVVESGRLVPGFTSTVWVRATTAAPDGIPVTITFAAEPGLRADKETVTTCDNGWAAFELVAEAHVVGGGFKAEAQPRGTGEWFGALPVAPGAFFVSVPRVLPEAKADTAVLIAPNPRNVVYAELDDEKGRVAAAALPVVVEAGDPTPRARFAIPPLAPGLHWLVVSGEPRGAEHLGGAAIARPILAGGAPGVDVQNACSVGPWLARRPAQGFPRWIALDGLPLRSAGNRARHRVGLLIGLIALLAAAVLEALLLVSAARAARVAMQLAELEEDQDAAKVTARPPGGGLAVALLVAVLGFALLAVLIVSKG